MGGIVIILISMFGVCLWKWLMVVVIDLMMFGESCLDRLMCNLLSNVFDMCCVLCVNMFIVCRRWCVDCSMCFFFGVNWKLFLLWLYSWNLSCVLSLVMCVLIVDGVMLSVFCVVLKLLFLMIVRKSCSNCIFMFLSWVSMVIYCSLWSWFMLVYIFCCVLWW